MQIHSNTFIYQPTYIYRNKYIIHTIHTNTFLDRGMTAFTLQYMHGHAYPNSTYQYKHIQANTYQALTVALAPLITSLLAMLLEMMPWSPTGTRGNFPRMCES